MTGLLLAAAFHASAMVSEVNIKGADDGVRTTKQQDYREAVLNAKLHVIERAGEPVGPLLAITNFQLRSEAVEAKAGKVLQPGFQIVDIGYVESGSYEVVLIGKVRSAGDQSVQAESGDQQVQAAIAQHTQGKTKPALRSLDALIQTSTGRVRTEALLAKGLMLAADARTMPKAFRTLGELKTQAPNSPEAQRLETVLHFKYIRYKLHNDVPKFPESKAISGIQEQYPYSFTYMDEAGKKDTLSFPSNSVCVNDACEPFRRKVMSDRREATVGRYHFVKACRDWSDATRASVNPEAIDVDCVMTIERTDLGL